MANNAPDPEGEEKKDDRALASMDMALGSPIQLECMDTSLWLGDTGALSHVTSNPEGIVNQVKINTGIVFGNGQILKAEFFHLEYLHYQQTKLLR